MARGAAVVNLPSSRMVELPRSANVTTTCERLSARRACRLAAARGPHNTRAAQATLPEAQGGAAEPGSAALLRCEHRRHRLNSPSRIIVGPVSEAHLDHQP